MRTASVIRNAMETCNFTDYLEIVEAQEECASTSLQASETDLHCDPTFTGKIKKENSSPSSLRLKLKRKKSSKSLIQQHPTSETYTVSEPNIYEQTRERLTPLKFKKWVAFILCLGMRDGGGIVYCTVGQFKSCRRGMGDSVFVFPLLELFFDDHIINATSLRIPGDNSEATTSWKVVPLRLEKRVLYPTVAPSLAFSADPGAFAPGQLKKQSWKDLAFYPTVPSKNILTKIMQNLAGAEQGIFLSLIATTNMNGVAMNEVRIICPEDGCDSTFALECQAFIHLREPHYQKQKISKNVEPKMGSPKMGSYDTVKVVKSWQRRSHSIFIQKDFMFFHPVFYYEQYFEQEILPQLLKNPKKGKNSCLFVIKFNNNKNELKLIKTQFHVLSALYKFAIELGGVHMDATYGFYNSFNKMSAKYFRQNGESVGETNRDLLIDKINKTKNIRFWFSSLLGTHTANTTRAIFKRNRFPTQLDRVAPSNCRIIIFCSGSNDTISQQVKHYSKTMKDPSTDEDDDDYLKVVYVPDYSIP